MPDLVVKPIDRATARRWCEDHPHAGTLPNSSKHYMAAYIGGRPAGLAAWGYGIRPTLTPTKLFGEAGHPDDYLELCRFFVYDWTPRYTATKFLAFTHRVLRRHTDRRWLYTYAAGFQGMVGTIYQAANYEYCGRHLTDAFILIPDVGLVHAIALWHRYGQSFMGPAGLARFQQIVPEARRWCGYNFRYIYWLDRPARDELIPHATFPIGEPNPTMADVEVWTEDPAGNRQPVTLEEAKAVPIVKLPSRRRKHR